MTARHDKTEPYGGSREYWHAVATDQSETLRTLRADLLREREHATRWAWAFFAMACAAGVFLALVVMP